MARILVVDDDPDIVETITLVLEGAGYEVVSAHSGKEGLQKAREEKPDLIVLDVMMETKRKGIEVAQQLRQEPQFASTPILMMTAVREKTGLGFKGEAGDDAWLPVDDYCEKPLKPETLIQKVRQLLKGKT